MAKKPLRVFRGRTRRISFYNNDVELQEWCVVCKSWGCYGSWQRRKRAIIRVILRAAGLEAKSVKIGCKTFRDPALLAYARRWVRKL